MDDEKQKYPNPLKAWAVVILLLCAYIMSYVDRSIFGILLDPIKADFNFSNFQMGLLGGLVFAVFYGGIGLPLGWLADKYSRKNIVAVGVAIWSLATAATGLARGFGSLAFSRMMTGAGEATLSPCAMSMISDMFPKEKRGRAIAVYSSAISIGIGLGNLAIAKLIQYSNTLDFVALSKYGIDKPWRLVFVAVGLPGLIIAILIFLIREPERRYAVGDSIEPMSIRQTLTHVKKHKAAFFGIFGLGCIMSTCTYYGYTWNPAFYTRTFGWPVSEYLRFTAYSVLAIGIPSMIAAGFFIDYLAKKGRTNAPLLVMKTGIFIVMAVFVAYPLMPTYMSAFIVFQFSTIGFTMATAAGPAALLAISPARMKAQIMAIYYMVISLTGLVVGPGAVGFLLDNVQRDDALIKYSLFIIALALIPPTIYFLIRSTKAYVAKVEA